MLPSVKLARQGDKIMGRLIAQNFAHEVAVRVAAGGSVYAAAFKFRGIETIEVNRSGHWGNTPEGCYAAIRDLSSRMRAERRRGLQRIREARRPRHRGEVWA